MSRNLIRLLAVILIVDSQAIAPTRMALADWRGPRSSGQRLYVPLYSSIPFMEGIEGQQLDFAVTVSIRNTDSSHSLRIEAMHYFGNHDELQGNSFTEPRMLEPLASAEIVIPQSTMRGDVGAKLILEWRSMAPVAPPVVEAVMVGVSRAQGFAFASRAVVLDEWH